MRVLLENIDWNLKLQDEVLRIKRRIEGCK